MDAVAVTTFILALIGALAWIPPILEWRRKPDVQIVSSEQIEVSYMAFGGVLNISCTFASFQKAALIESLKLSLQHEDGARLEFFCVGLSESATAQSSSGERVFWNKETRGHALAIPQDSAVEKLVLFRDRAQSTAVRRFYERLVPLYQRLQANEGATWREAMRRTPEFDEYLRLVQNGQPWRRGKYSAVLTARVRGLSAPIQHRFAFEFSDADVRVVITNLEPLSRYVTSTLLESQPTMQQPVPMLVYPARQIEDAAPPA